MVQGPRNGLGQAQNPPEIVGKHTNPFKLPDLVCVFVTCTILWKAAVPICEAGRPENREDLGCRSLLGGGAEVGFRV